MKQKQAVYLAVCKVLKRKEFDVAVNLTKEQRSLVQAHVLRAFANDEVDFKESAKVKHNTEAKMSGYISGLISNWLRKDRELNGDITYEPKNKGSRAGQGDSQIRELRKLKKIHNGSKKEAEIQGYIDSRLSVIASAKAKDIMVDFSKLPKELQDLAPTKS